MNPDQIIHAGNSQEFWTDERCYITELLNAEIVPDVSLARVRVGPGVTTQLHSLRGTEEIYIVCTGKGMIEIDGHKTLLSKGDQAIVPRTTPQRITNVSQEDLHVLCICRPRFQPASYNNLEVDTE